MDNRATIIFDEASEHLNIDKVKEAVERFKSSVAVVGMSIRDYALPLVPMEFVELAPLEQKPRRFLGAYSGEFSLTMKPEEYAKFIRPVDTIDMDRRTERNRRKRRRKARK